jgi:AbiJ N-terminal domain 4
MAKFSDRHGYTQSAIQTEGMNDALRNSIWNFISEPMTFTDDGVTWRRLLSVLADEFFKVPIETVPKYDSDLGRKWLRKHYDRLEWYEVYNLLEYTVAWAELSSVLLLGSGFGDGPVGHEAPKARVSDPLPTQRPGP